MLVDEKFKAIATQLAERDKAAEQIAALVYKMVDQAAITAKVAVDAAFQAQEKGFSSQNASNDRASATANANFTKLIEQQASSIDMVRTVQESRMGDLKELVSGLDKRIAAIEGRHTSNSSNTATIISIAVAAAAMVSVAMSVLTHVSANLPTPATITTGPPVR